MRRTELSYETKNGWMTTKVRYGRWPFGKVVYEKEQVGPEWLTIDSGGVFGGELRWPKGQEPSEDSITRTTSSSKWNVAAYNPGGPVKPPPTLETFQGDRFEPVTGGKTLWERQTGHIDEPVTKPVERTFGEHLNNPRTVEELARDNEWPVATALLPHPKSKTVWDPKCENCGERVRYEVEYYGGYPPPTRCTRHWVHVHDGKEPCTFFLGRDGRSEPKVLATCVHCGEDITERRMGAGSWKLVDWVHAATEIRSCANGFTVATFRYPTDPPMEKPMTDHAQCLHCGNGIERRRRDDVWIHSTDMTVTCTGDLGTVATTRVNAPVAPKHNPLPSHIGATGPAAPVFPDDLVTGLARLVLTHGAPLVKEAIQALWQVTR